MQVNIERVLSKRVSELTGEDKRVLREWLRSVRSPASYDIDLRRWGKRVPVFVRTWAKHPERYDIPGVDTPLSSTAVQKRPQHIKLDKYSYAAELDKAFNRLMKVISGTTLVYRGIRPEKYMGISDPFKRAVRVIEDLSDYGIVYDSRITRLAQDWLDKIRGAGSGDAWRVAREALEDLAGYIDWVFWGMRDVSRDAQRLWAESVATVNQREEAVRTLNLGRLETAGGEEERGEEDYDELARYLWESIPRRLRSGRRRKWSYIQARALAKYIYNLARAYGIDPYQYDWAHIIDWEQGYGHAKETVAKMFSVHGGIEHSMEHGGKYMGYGEELEQEIERSYRELGEIGRRLVEEPEEPYMLDPATKWELEHLLY